MILLPIDSMALSSVWVAITLILTVLSISTLHHGFNYATPIRVIPGQVITKNGRTPSDFNETWYIHTLSEVINPHPF